MAAEASLAKAGDSPRARTFLALARAATGRCESVEPALQGQFENGADATLRRLAGLGYVQCLLARGHYDTAYPVAAGLRELYPKDADVLFQNARLHMKAWNDTIRAMFDETPASYRVNQISAEVFEIQGKYTEAISEYRKAIEKNPAAVNLHYRLARAILMESHAPEALEAARQEFLAELKLNPRDAVAEYQVGQILLAQQKRAEGTARIERAIELAPDFTRALVALGKIRMENKQIDEAVQVLEEAVRSSPSSESARYGLMRAYRRAGRKEDALKQKEELEKLQKPPEGEFTDFLKRIGEKPAPQK
ncbi:MAG: tetratricopeptide repeat protein [bacterium]|nr:tetratricopeptide repeat protein [bacterium]